MTETAFTVLVNQRHADERFEFGDLLLAHGECGGGEVVKRRDDDLWYFRCSRCDTMMSPSTGNDGTVAIVRTAIDGERRRVVSRIGGPAFVERRP